MGKHSRWSDLASSASWDPKGQVLELDLWHGLRQDLACNTYALEYDPAQRRVGSSRRWTGSSSSSACLHILSHLLERTSTWNLVLLASPGAGVKITFYRHPIHEFSFAALDGKEKWTAYKFTKNVYDIWMPTHFKRICSVIDELPPDVDFEVSELGESGLSQGLEGHHLSDQSCQSSHVPSRDITPDNSLSQNIEGRAFKKPKKRERPVELHQGCQ